MHGEVTDLLPVRRKVPVEEYLRLQRRFRHLFDETGAVREPETVAALQRMADQAVHRVGSGGTTHEGSR